MPTINRHKPENVNQKQKNSLGLEIIMKKLDDQQAMIEALSKCLRQ